MSTKGKMMRLLGVLLCVLVGAGGLAHADITINNFSANGFSNTDVSRRVIHHDVAGNTMDAHSGNILQVGTTFYLYGEHHSCGFRWQVVSPFCGIRVYSSTDLINWTDQGYLFDGSTAFWQNRCAPTGGTSGCFRPRMVYNAANNNYVIWFNGFNGAIGSTSHLFQLICTTPTGGCTAQTDPTIGNGPAGDHNILVDGSNAYLIYSNMSTRDIWVVQLNAGFTAVTGSETRVAIAGGEGVAGFVRAGKYNVLFGSLCAYCAAGGTTLYAQASTPLGTYNAPIQIDTSNTCNSQIMEVDVITGGASTNYLLGADSWSGLYNQGWATRFHFPLTFTGDAINTVSCPTTVTVLGLTTVGSYPTPNSYPHLTGFAENQTNYAFGDVFADRCVITNSQWVWQTFVPTASNLYAIGTPHGINHVYSGSDGSVPDGSVQIDVFAADGSHNPTGSSLGTVTIPASSLQWSAQWTTDVFNITGLTPGAEYGMRTKGVGITATDGCFTQGISQQTSTSAYASGVEKFSSNSGATWAVDTNAAQMFATYTAAGGVPPVSAMVH